MAFEIVALILFLDFDGVLHPIGGKTEPFNCVPELWRILRTCPDVHVVFSTSWRESYPFDYLVDFATSNGGEELADRFIGSTPVLSSSDGAMRQAECEQWVADQGLTDVQWLAIDDDPNGFTSPVVHLVDQHQGLTTDQADAVIDRLQVMAGK